MKPPYLLTPGPLTTSTKTKEAMLVDWGSWDKAFNRLTAQVCSRLLKIARGENTHVCVPLQGSGTFAVEAAIGTLLPQHAKVLVPSNGAYCERMLTILKRQGKKIVRLAFPENSPVMCDDIKAMLQADNSITHVALVHCETSTGVMNPLDSVADMCASMGVSLVVDAMSTFGALPIDVERLQLTAVIAASGKCIEGVPGMGFVICKRSVLELSQGNSASLSMDLFDQWNYMQKTGQWRFTPPTHVVAALSAALDQFEAEGGQPVRLIRYTNNYDVLIQEMEKCGFVPFLDSNDRSPIIVTFHAPDHPAYVFSELYQRVRDKGFVLYPGKLTQVETFRVGCIGAIDKSVMMDAVTAISEAWNELREVSRAH